MNCLEQLYDEMSKGTLILTPNRRLSAWLKALYQKHQLNLAKTAWQTPVILPLTSWLTTLYEKTTQDFSNSSLLLNQVQEQFLWETVIAQSTKASELLQKSETAKLAKSGWRLLMDWQIDLEDPIFNSSEDYLVFQQWALDFQKRCKETKRTDQASLPNILNTVIKKWPDKLILVGFTEISPLMNHFFKKNSIQAIKIEMALHTTQARVIQLSDEEHEMSIMAQWANKLIQANPTVSIGCVFPALDSQRERVKAIFSEVLGTEALFNLSAGKKLSQYSIIKSALQLLDLNNNKLLMDCLLSTPFIGEAENERLKRAQFDNELRKRNNCYLDFSTQSQDLLILHCPALAKRLQAYFALKDTLKSPLTYREWTVHFSQLLALLGWPGERSLQSMEYQVMEAWLNLMIELMTLDQLSAPVYFDQALNTLHHLANQTLFQAKTPDAPIQLLGTLEAASLPFDYLWVAGMDDLSWPPQPKPHPFIPKILQRKHQMPHSTSQREIIFCQLLIQQYQQAAKVVIFSHAEKKEALVLQPSPLIRHLPNIKLAELELPIFQTNSEKIFISKSQEVISDEQAPPLTQAQTIKGGVKVIQSQALCPFKAFSEWRLHARELEKPLIGWRAKERGTIVHAILASVWKELGDHDTLMSKNENELKNILERSIDQAFSAPLNLYLRLEKSRLFKLIHDWLQLEKNRTPFKVITHEKGASITLNNLTFSTRIDRIDELENGKQFIIDYKTGKNNDIKHWFGERPTEPQLPLYAMLSPAETIGISFALLCTGHYGFKGVSGEALDLSGIKDLHATWQEQLLSWKTIFNQLSDDFYQGKAAVDPKEKVLTCARCTLQTLCRVNEESHELT